MAQKSAQPAGTVEHIPSSEHGERNVYLLQIAPLDTRTADEARRLRRRRARAGEVREQSLHFLHHRVMLDRARGRDHHGVENTMNNLVT